VSGSGDLQHMGVFFFFAGTLLFGRNIIAAEIHRNGVILGTVNQPLLSSRNGKLGGIGLAIVISNFAGHPMKKFNHRIVAEVKFVGSLQVYDSGEGYYARKPRFVCRQAERKLASGGMAYHRDSVAV